MMFWTFLPILWRLKITDLYHFAICYDGNHHVAIATKNVSLNSNTHVGDPGNADMADLYIPPFETGICEYTRWRMNLIALGTVENHIDLSKSSIFVGLEWRY